MVSTEQPSGSRLEEPTNRMGDGLNIKDEVGCESGETGELRYEAVVNGGPPPKTAGMTISPRGQILDLNSEFDGQDERPTRDRKKRFNRYRGVTTTNNQDSGLC